MNGDAIYNLNNLQTYDPLTRVGINVQKIIHTDAPSTVGDVVPIANASDSNAPTSEQPSKAIILKGTIHGDSQSDLDDRIDAFKAIFARRNKDLDIAYGSGYRRYSVMKINTIGIDRLNTALWGEFTVELLCKPFGIDITSTVLLNQVASTVASRTVAATIGGSAPYQMPRIEITINALSGAGDFVQISNDNNGQEMIIAGQALTAGDVLVIDALTHDVTLNGDDIDYYGTFLELEPGLQTFTILDGFTTRSVDILVEYHKRWQ